MNLSRLLLAFVSLTALATSCVMDRAPRGLRRTPDGPGATVRFDLAHQPLPDIPLPIDTATWPDPTSRTGLRVNASLFAPTAIERQARGRFSELEGWGTFTPISVSFDVTKDDPRYPEYASYTGAALDLANIKKRHQRDDYDFADDAVYLVNLKTGVPAVLDVGAGNFNYTLNRLDMYWANDTRASERNLNVESRDETQRGAITPELFRPEDDTDFDGMLDVPNLDDPYACPDPDLEVCDNGRADSAEYGSPECVEARRARDRCIADHLMTWYERETDSLLLRPLLPLDEMTRYAVVITDRTADGKGNPVKSPFEFVYHATQESAAQRVMDILNDASKASYFGDIAGTGLDHVAFAWSFTTQPTVDDMKRLRDGLYGHGPFKRWSSQFPPRFELQRMVGRIANDEDTPEGTAAGCPAKLGNLYMIKNASLRENMKQLVTRGLGGDAGPAIELLMRQLDNVDHMVIGTYTSPFLLEGGPKATDPNAAFHVNYLTGEVGDDSNHEDTVQFWLIVPKETAQFKQPFNVNIFGHGYQGASIEQIIYAGNMAAHGIATIGINAMGHGLVFRKDADILGVTAALDSACVAPFYDALTAGRARDLDNDGIADSGRDFWSSYVFHTRDGLRQSILDQIQLVRILRTFGSSEGAMLCRNAVTGWDQPGTQPCDVNADGKPEVIGDFNADGVADVGGLAATYGTWGESLGGVLSAIHGSIDAYVTAASPGSGGGGLTDIAIRSFQGGVVEAVLLRLWGPLLVSIPSADRPVCTPESKKEDHCTICGEGQVSLRWVVPDLNVTGEIEVTCVDPQDVDDSTVFVRNTSNGEIRCGRVDQDHRFRIGIPSSTGDRIQVEFYDKKDMVESYKTCIPKAEILEALPRTKIDVWGKGIFTEGYVGNLETCTSPTCTSFQEHLFGEGTALVAPADGYGLLRQTPSTRRFMQLAQAALEPGDPVSFAPYYSIKRMTDPFGNPIAPHALLTLNTIGDMIVPLSSGIAFARAAGALPFLRPEQAEKYPEYANYTTPAALYDALGQRTPNQELIDRHVIEGIAALARHPAGPECAESQNSLAVTDGTFLSEVGEARSCFPGPQSPQDKDKTCTAESEQNPNLAEHVCYVDTHCDTMAGQCMPNDLGTQRCEEALWDPDNLDEGKQKYFEQNSPVPHRLARFTQPATQDTIEAVWAPRIRGVPFGPDDAWTPDDTKPLTALLDAYIVPEGTHTFSSGKPCQAFDQGTYLANLTARFFMTNGTDIYYLSHPKTHQCLAAGENTCGYLHP